MASNLVVTSLSLTIGFFFIFVGLLKLTPQINEDAHREVRKQFVQFSKVFPGSKYTGFKPKPTVYRKVVGWLEIVCGAILVVIPGPLKQVANFLLLLQCVLTMYIQWSLEEKLDRLAPSLVFTLLLCCRYFVQVQVTEKEKRLAQARKAE